MGRLCDVDGGVLTVDEQRSRRRQGSMGSSMEQSEIVGTSCRECLHRNMLVSISWRSGSSLEHTLMSLASYIVAVLALNSKPALNSAVAERSDGIFFGVVGHEAVDY